MAEHSIDEPIQVFISYTHDSAEHKKRVLELAQQLRQDGITTELDQYVNGTPEEGWPRWMERQVKRAQFVLIVCTETYLRRYNAEEAPGKGLGGTWEAGLALQELYEAQGKNTKFIPVIFDEGSRQSIPAPLRAATNYLLPRDHELLLRYILDQPAVIPAPIGERKKLPPNP